MRVTEIREFGSVVGARGDLNALEGEIALGGFWPASVESPDVKPGVKIVAVCDVDSDLAEFDAIGAFAMGWAPVT